MPRDRATPNVVPQPQATQQLRALMTAASIPSFRALARQAGVSDWVVRQLRSDRISHMRIDHLQKLAAALNLSLLDLLAHFGIVSAPTDKTAPASQIATLEAEYERLQQQLQAQESQLYDRFQTEAIAIIESWLIQWPTVVQAVARNPDLPASRLIPLVEPLQTLLEHWNIEAIAPVGAEIPYDPQQHQLLTGTTEPGNLVRVRYTGFHRNGALLYRAKVSPLP